MLCVWEDIWIHWMIQIKKYLAEIRLVGNSSLPEMQGTKLPFQRERRCAHPMRAAGLARTFVPGAGMCHQCQLHPWGLSVCWERWQKKSTKSSTCICKHWRIVLPARYKAKRPWPVGSRSKWHTGKLVTAWHILAAGPYIHVSVISKELVNYLTSLK